MLLFYIFNSSFIDYVALKSQALVISISDIHFWNSYLVIGSMYLNTSCNYEIRT